MSLVDIRLVCSLMPFQTASVQRFWSNYQPSPLCPLETPKYITSFARLSNSATRDVQCIVYWLIFCVMQVLSMRSMFERGTSGTEVRSQLSGSVVGTASSSASPLASRAPPAVDFTQLFSLLQSHNKFGFIPWNISAPRELTNTCPLDAPDMVN